MNIDFASAISAFELQKAKLDPTATGAAQAVASPGFGKLLVETLEGMNAGQVGIGEKIQSFLTGQGPNVHTLMMEIEKANLAVEFGVQVRNKAMEAYNEIMHMQV